MTSPPQANPYQSPETEAEAPEGSINLFQTLCLGWVALALLYHGVLMGFAWSLQFRQGFQLPGAFAQAMFFKDSVTALTALAGGLLLFALPHVGWWAAVVHWCWRLSWSVAMVALAEAFSWQLPVRYELPRLYWKTSQSLALGLLALAVLFWRPIMKRCGVDKPRRLPVLGMVFTATLLAALAVNWWSGLR